MIPPDASERRRALDPAGSFIVRAPAGSGKTELLIQRYLTLLARVEQPENVVAITFTRKAADEMRRRVVAELRDSRGPLPAESHRQRTWQLARAVWEHDRALGWQIFDNPNRLAIRTIDSLCASIARQMPWLSRLGAPPEVVEDASELYAEAARRTLELLENPRWAAEVATLLLHLDNDSQVLAGMLAGMLAQRDQWLRHVAGGNQRETLEAALANVVADALAEVRRQIPNDIAREMAALARSAAAALAADGRESPTLACAGMDELGSDLDEWLGVAHMLLTKDGGWRKSPNALNGFPRGSDTKQRCKDLLASLENHDALRHALDGLRILPSPSFPDRQWEVLQALVTLLPVAVAQLRMLFSERGQADFSELAMAASQALGTPDAPTDLALTFDYRIQHLLVDEMQDTSVSQFELLEKLTAGWEPGDGRTLFLVGDPMQSIYRFRQAEVGLFLTAERHGVGSVRLERLQLTANFRSGLGIVDWVNGTFPTVLARTPDLLTGAVPFERSEAVNPPGVPQAVTLHPFIGRDDEAEAQRVVELIHNVRAPGRKIAILVRARTHLTAIVRRLREANLRFRAVDIDCLGEVPVVQDLTALTRALLHPGDRIAWLAVLRAPWCGLTLAELHALAGASPYAAVWDLVREDTRIPRLERTRKALAAALARRPTDLREWIERTWVELGGPACLDGPADMDNAMAFFDLVEQLDEGGTLDLSALKARAGELYARPDPQAGEELQVLSIHKAKGLQFDVVIVPGLGRRPRNDETRLLLWLERGRDLLLAPVHATGAGPEKIYDYLSYIGSRKEENETGRLLYVAATRAIRELHLLGHVEYDHEKGALKKPASGSLLERMWQVAEPVFAGAAAPQQTERETAARAPQSIRRLTIDWRQPFEETSAPVPPGNAPLSFHWVADTPRHTGTVVHALLRNLAEEGAASWDPAARREAIEAALLSLGVPPREVPNAAAEAITAVSNTLEDPRGQWILAAHEGAACEFALASASGLARIDRTFIDETGTRWIIDYKTGGGDELDSYREQMEKYLALFAALEDRPVRAALYFPLLKSWREVAPLAQRSARVI